MGYSLENAVEKGTLGKYEAHMYNGTLYRVTPPETIRELLYSTRPFGPDADPLSSASSSLEGIRKAREALAAAVGRSAVSR